MTRAISNLSNFIFEKNSIRAEVVGETPWFVAKDVAAALGIEWRGSSTLARIKAAWKGVRNFRTPGGNQELTVINEPAVYKFAFRSNKEEADKFTDWLAGEVLPSIRRTGAYEEKPIHVQAHDRRTSVKVDDAVRLKKNIDRLESVVTAIQPTQPNFCAMVVDGEPVFVDTNRYSGAGRAVVMGHDGRMYIEHVEPDSHGFKPMGVRTAMGQRHATPSGGTGRNAVMVVGMVMEPALDMLPRPTPNRPALNLPAPDRQAVVDQVTGQLRGQIMTLLDAVPWDDQRIARELCCNPKLVREVRRIQSSKSPAVQPMRQIEHEPEQRPKRTVYRDEILRLFNTGMTNREIAQETGATYQAVTHWRRWAADRA